jgi:hypothetical protein
MAFNTQPVDFNYFLAQKYAVLKQQADAGSESARAQSTNAATAAITGRAAANLDTTRANLMPAESQAQIALQGAQTGLTRNQAQVVVPLAQAQIRGMDATTAFTGTQNKVLTRNELTPQSELFGSGGLGGSTLPSMFHFSDAAPSDTKPARLRGESASDYMNRTGWGL